MTAKRTAEHSYTPAEQLALWEECLAVISDPYAAYAIAGRSYTKEDSDKVLRQVQYWQSRVNESEPSAANLARLVRR